MYGTDHDRYLRDSHSMYLESYDYEADDTPPLGYEDWLRAYGDDLIRDGLAYDLIDPKDLS